VDKKKVRLGVIIIISNSKYTCVFINRIYFLSEHLFMMRKYDGGQGVNFFQIEIFEKNIEKYPPPMP